ncbi:MAG: hypothetical protein CMH54_14565 [Myxococcales bacterium]|nr:hypothetical protein [Myxococcales bacterium]
MKPNTHRKALRAAQSVVAGARRQFLPSLAGLALVAYLPGCGSTGTGSPQDIAGDQPASIDHQTHDSTPPFDTPAETTSTDLGCLQLLNTSCSDEIPCDGLEQICLEGNCYAQDVSMDPTSEPGGCAESDSTMCPEGSFCVEDQCYEIGESTLAAQACCNEITLAGNEKGLEALGVPGCTPCYMETEFTCNEDDTCTGLGLHCVDGQCWAGQFSSIPVGVTCSEEAPCEEGFCQSGDCLISNTVGHDAMDICCQKHFRVNHFGLAGCTPWGPPAPPAYDGSRLIGTVIV